jgi:putative flippase GtrA
VISHNITLHESPPVSAGKQALLRWLRFNLVGVIGIFLQLGLLFLLKNGLHLNYRIATAMAVESAVIHNFIWHERFTWVDRLRCSRGSSIARLVRFNSSNGAISLIGSLGLMEVAIRLAHVNYMTANAFSIGICSLLNFLVSDNYVFRGSNQATK